MSKYASKENLQYLWKKSKTYTDEKLSVLPGAVGYRNGSTIVVDNLEAGDYLARAVNGDGVVTQLVQFSHPGTVTHLKPGIPEDCTYIEICRPSGELRGRVRTVATVIAHPDFAQTDEKAVTFIANKTHWSDYSEILPRTTAAYSEEIGAHVLYEFGTLKPDITCTVVFNGTEYTCPVYVENDGGFDVYILGNYAAMTETGDTGEPFALVVYPEEFALEIGFRAGVLVTDGSTEDIALSVSSGSVHKLDNMFLYLSWLPVAEERPLSNECTVDTSGTFIPYGDGTDAWSVVKSVKYVYVYWDNVKYKCYITGNSVDGLGVGFVGETLPFNISFITEKFYVQFTEEGTHTIKLSYRYVNYLPEEFLPVSVDSVVLRSSTEGSSKKFAITVDDNGTLTATET